MFHDYHTISRCVHEGQDSFKLYGYHDPKGCPYRDSERSVAWHRGVFRADHAHAGRTGFVLSWDDFMKDLMREIRLSSTTTDAFAGEY